MIFLGEQIKEKKKTIPSERKFKLKNRSIADGFPSFLHTRGATPLSFARATNISPILG